MLCRQFLHIGALLRQQCLFDLLLTYSVALRVTVRVRIVEDIFHKRKRVCDDLVLGFYNLEVIWRIEKSAGAVVYADCTCKVRSSMLSVGALWMRTCASSAMWNHASLWVLSTSIHSARSGTTHTGRFKTWRLVYAQTPACFWTKISVFTTGNKEQHIESYLRSMAYSVDNIHQRRPSAWGCRWIHWTVGS